MISGHPVLVVHILLCSVCKLTFSSRNTYEYVLYKIFSFIYLFYDNLVRVIANNKLMVVNPAMCGLGWQWMVYGGWCRPQPIILTNKSFCPDIMLLSAFYLLQGHQFYYDDLPDRVVLGLVSVGKRCFNYYETISNKIWDSLDQ